MRGVVQKKLYEAVFDGIIERIVAGEFTPGSMLPGEFDLADDFQVSQGTARKALIELEKRRIVERRQGKGTFVTLRTPENSLFHFFRLRDGAGNQVVPDLASEEIARRAASQNEHAKLFGQPKEVFEIKRLRTYKEQPLCVETSIIPVELFPGLQERAPLPNTLYVLFQQAYGCAIISAEDEIIASAAGRFAKELDSNDAEPVLIAHRTAYDLLDRAIELRESVYLTKAAHYRVKLD